MNRITINTSRVVYLPQEVLAADTARWYLGEAGIEVEAGDGIVLSPVVDGIGAVMVEKQEVIEHLIKGVQSPSFISPAQELPAVFRGMKHRGESLSFIARIEDRVVYIVAFDANAKMFLVEAYPYDTATDIVFILDVLLKNEYDWHLYYIGEATRECRRLLHKRFRRREITAL